MVMGSVLRIKAFLDLRTRDRRVEKLVVLMI